MIMLIATLTYTFVLLYSCGAQFLFFPADDFFPKEDEFVVCPESCPAESEPFCTSNGFCIKLFDGLCQVVYFNCKNKEEYKQIHPQYCEDPRYRNLQPTACFNETLATIKN